VRQNVRTSIIYLTAHSVPPLRDLASSMKGEPPIRLAWLSWRDVWAVAERARAGKGAIDAAGDLADLLRHKGLFEFNGFDEVEPVASRPTTAAFWKEGAVRRPRQERFFATPRQSQPHVWMGLQGHFFSTPQGGRL